MVEILKNFKQFLTKWYVGIARGLGRVSGEILVKI